MPSLRSPGQRAGLTRDGVLTAARELLAERGIDGLSMRPLAERLGVHPNALYSHVDSKTALVDDILDEALAAVETPGPDAADPIAGVQALMTSSYQVLLARADLIPAYLARHGARGPHAQHLGNVILALLGRAGVTGPAAREALHVLIVYTIGSAAFATRSPLATEGASAAQHHGAHFDHGLRWLLAGIGLDEHD
ncbi:MAG: TetR family transcriptional regulator [Actinomycetota bacterium]|nr:TetR family transcriptional regulator [Actinomycetota bacterium]